MIKLDEYYREFENIQNSIDELLNTPEQVALEDAYRAQIENAYYHLKAINMKVNQNAVNNDQTLSSNNADQNNQQIVALIDTLTANQTTLGNLVQTMSNQPSASTPLVTTPHNSVQLPRINLPQFDGSNTAWIHFRDLFSALIHDNNSLSSIEKFEYLQSHIKGDALSLVKHLGLSNDNYMVAWNLITNKYNDSQQLKKEYLRLLFDQPVMRGPSSVDLKRFLNNTNESINALKALNEDLDQWNSMLLFHLERKLDFESQTLWSRSSPESPTYKDFLQFLDKRLRELENCQVNKTSLQQHSNRQRPQSYVHTTSVRNCPVCHQLHPLFSCSKFKALNIHDRIQVIKNNRMCYNCLSHDHLSPECTKSACKICKGRHNTLLHRSEKNDNNNTQSESSGIQRVNVGAVSSTNSRKITLLPTAVAMILGADENYYPCRILLDTGAQANLISEACVERLKLRRSYDKTLLCGVGNDNKNYTRGKVQIVVKSTMVNKQITTTALCLAKLTQLQPPVQVVSTELNFFNHLPLADPHCNSPHKVDLILGANVFCEWFMNNQIIHPSGNLSAMYTIFGWVLLGEVTSSQQHRVTIAHTCLDMSEQIQNFWKIEELHESSQHMSEDEQKAEHHFKNTVQREDSGRYIVRLPFKNSRPTFANTEHQAAKRLSNMENKFNKNHQLYTDYKYFMDEYLQLDHMEIAKKKEDVKYYLPHHSVIKTDSSTTKLRVVFDGSARDINSASLNDQLLVGPTIQKDIFDILTQFRKYSIALKADIEKMYRQILIHPEDRIYQCILWRPNKNDEVKAYQLKTVTYGTSAAPFLAVRTLKQIAIDIQEDNPNIADIIMNCFYVDDFMFSISDEQAAAQTKLQVCKFLSKAGFNLRKWSSNSEDFLSTIGKKDQELSNQTIIDNSHTVKTLGLYWDTSSDVFKYSVTIPETTSQATKRTVLSIISRIYDPLGWLSPVVIMFKIFMQKLWLRGLDWDSLLPDPLLEQWQRLHHHINDIKSITVPRWLHYLQGHQVELHGFADSSELAYAAVVYIKIIHKDGSVKIGLVASKSRVAPMKQITLPRLELCACQLLTKLFMKVKNALQLPNVETHGWTDSMIVLSWLSDHPRRWKNFVANRTSFIINILPAQYWHHIQSSHNPADLATRGTMPLQLQKSVLWWNGPPELQESIYKQPVLKKCNIPDLETRKNTILHITNNNEQTDILQRYSNYSKLLRTTAIILRFINNCKSHNRQTGYLKATELINAHNILIKRSQHLTFKQEISILSSNKQLSQHHKLASLNPFIDDSGLLRVGGRLENANITYEQKHPLIMHKDCFLTQLIVQYYHLKHLHAGSRQLQYLLSMKYWIPSATYVIKRCVYKCTTCVRYRSKPFMQQMGNLPEHRLKSATAFENVGVDFAGPFCIRSWKGRGSKNYKAWIAVFVCLTVKAIHLELVTELSTAAFLASLRRFVSRRGKPTHIYSDNGTNFVGCNQRLKEIIQFMLKTSTQESIAKETSELNIQWHFSPPSGPHFGGIWEAGVKSLKYHLYRVMGNASVTYEELSTILCQIESCLNSRPLTAKYEGDPDPLTPGHFLIMKPLQAVPDQNVAEFHINRLTRWQFLQKLVQLFWKKWSSSYLSQLQNRPKWKIKLKNMQINDVVLLKDELTPPCKWPIVIITEVHPGQDNLVRVVTVKTTKGIYKRPLSKICPLIVD